MVEGNGGSVAITENELKRFWKLKHKIELLESKIIELEKIMVVPGCQQITGMPRGGSDSHDKIANVIARLEDLKMSCMAKLDELVKLWVDIEEAVEQLSFEEQRVISLYYMNCYTWDEVAEVTGMSRRTVFRVHDRALEALQRI